MMFNYKKFVMSKAKTVISSYQADRDKSDLKLLVRLASVAFLASLLLCWRFYIHDVRVFGLTPVLPFLTEVPPWFEWALLSLNVTLLAWLIARPLDQLPIYGVLFCSAFWILQDIARFQPYIYMYCFTVFMALFSSRTDQALTALKIMVCGVYFWAGFHKLNASYYFSVAPWFFQPFYDLSNHSNFMNIVILALSFSIPIFEFMIGVFFVFPETRRLASFFSLMMCIVILGCLGPIGRDWNVIVWVWTTYLFVTAFILFFPPPRDAESLKFVLKPILFIPVILFVIAPAFALFGLWHSFPSFKLYSGNVVTAAVQLVKKEDPSLLPDGLGKLVNQERVLQIAEWTLLELNIIPYPETFVYRTGARGLCRYLTYPSEAILRIYMPPPFYSLKGEVAEEPLCR